jgi:outer membrane protein with beta-barrel domain
MMRQVRWVAGIALALSLAGPLRAEWQQGSSGRGAIQILRDVGSEDGSREHGLGLSLDLDAYQTEHLGLRASLGYFQLDGWRADDPFGGPYRSDLNALYLSLGPILRAPHSLVSPYVTAGAGFYLMDYSSFLELDVGGGARARAALTGGSLSLGLHGAGGLDINLGDGFGLGAELSFTDVLSQGRNLELLGLHLGLDYHFE